MKIRVGTGGIPVRCKGGSTPDGIKYVSELKLNSMEVEFVRGVRMGLGMGKKAGEIAKKLGIRLSVHAPYYVNLCSPEKDKVRASRKRIIDSAERAHAMGADVVVFHPGYYGKLSGEEAFEVVVQQCEIMKGELKKKKITGVKLGMETTGKVKQFGTLDETIRASKKVKRCVPVIDFAHIYARQAGRIDFPEIFDKISVLKLKEIHAHFSCIRYSPVKNTGMGNESNHLTLDTKKPDYEPLVKEILKRKVKITLISESPNLETDALIMKEMFERHGYEF